VASEEALVDTTPAVLFASCRVRHNHVHLQQADKFGAGDAQAPTVAGGANK